jgi:hypothetical protein
MDYVITPREMEKLLAAGFLAGFQKCLEELGQKPRYISQNKAYREFKKIRVQNWVEDGLIKPKPNGGGRTSTIQYEYSRLLELDTSDTIVIRKAYISTSKT